MPAIGWKACVAIAHDGIRAAGYHLRDADVSQLRLKQFPIWENALKDVEGDCMVKKLGNQTPVLAGRVGFR